MEEGDDEARKRKAAKERQMAEDRRQQRDRSSTKHQELALSDSRASSSTTVAAAAAGPPRLVSKEGLTAMDIDGRDHESHKFGSVWKDWDASKKEDPGEIARMFMKVSAVKRRGY